MKNYISIMSMMISIALLAVACSSDDDPTKGVGYLNIDAEIVTLINPRTRAVPADYNPKQLAVRIVDKATGVVKYKTDNYESSPLDLIAPIMLAQKRLLSYLKRRVL